MDRYLYEGGPRLETQPCDRETRKWVTQWDERVKSLVEAMRARRMTIGPFDIDGVLHSFPVQVTHIDGEPIPGNIAEMMAQVNQTPVIVGKPITGRLTLHRPNMQNYLRQAAGVDYGALEQHVMTQMADEGYGLVSKLGDSLSFEPNPFLAIHQELMRLGERAVALGIDWDMYRARASVQFNVPYTEVTSVQRHEAKSDYFAILYSNRSLLSTVQ